jgi:hypothetical protein
LLALAVECPHPEVVLQYIREEQEETRKPLTAGDMLRGAEIIEDGAEDKKH